MTHRHAQVLSLGAFALVVAALATRGVASVALSVLAVVAAVAAGVWIHRHRS